MDNATNLLFGSTMLVALSNNLKNFPSDLPISPEFAIVAVMVVIVLAFTYNS